MVILIPLIIIFLSLAYLKIAEDITLLDKVLAGFVITVTLAVSLILYRKIKQNLKQHEINLILIEINETKKELGRTQDEKHSRHLERKLQKLKKELDTIQVS